MTPETLYDIGFLINCIWVPINILAAFIQLWIIYKLVDRKRAKFNGFLMLVTLMTVYQLFFDCYQMLFPGSGPLCGANQRWCRTLYFYGMTSNGLLLSFWSLTLSCTVSYIIIRREILDIKKKIPRLFFFFNIICTLFGTVIGYYSYTEDLPNEEIVHKVYACLRLALLLFNGISIILTLIEVYGNRSRADKALSPIQALSMRLLLYPIVQAITRIFASWYLLGYKNDSPCRTSTGSLRIHGSLHNCDSFYVAYMLYPIFSVGGGLGDLLVFLKMQPGSLDALMKPLFKFCCGMKWVNRSEISNNKIKIKKANGDSGEDIYTDTENVSTDFTGAMPSPTSTSRASTQGNYNKNNYNNNNRNGSFSAARKSDAGVNNPRPSNANANAGHNRNSASNTDTNRLSYSNTYSDPDRYSTTASELGTGGTGYVDDEEFDEIRSNYDGGFEITMEDYFGMDEEDLVSEIEKNAQHSLNSPFNAYGDGSAFLEVGGGPINRLSRQVARSIRLTFGVTDAENNSSSTHRNSASVHPHAGSSTEMSPVSSPLSPPDAVSQHGSAGKRLSSASSPPRRTGQFCESLDSHRRKKCPPCSS